MTTRRSTFQLEQEQKSRLQLAERLSDFGWHFTSPSPDLGEDFIVEIYHDGKNTGVTFYVQEKSVTNLLARKNKKEQLVYQLKVKDIKHWESFSLPVVIVVWDVNLREGRWCLVRELISYLDQNNPKWRKNKKEVQIYIPWGNEMNDNGLKRLKSEIGKQVYPLISSGKDLEINMKLAFPKTPEGANLRKAFDLHIKEGEPVTLKGDVIQELKFPDWWEVWFGGFELKQTEIQISESSLQRSIPVSFRIIPTQGKTVSLRNLELRTIRVGTELVKFNNEHTPCPLLITFVLRKEEKLLQGTLSYLFRHVGGEPHEIMNFLEYAKAMASGGKLQVEFHDTNQSISTNFSPIPKANPDLAFYDLVQKLCVVQDKTGHFLKIPEVGISQKDANSIYLLFDIVQKGVVTYQNSVLSLELKDQALQMLNEVHKLGKPVHLRFEEDESYVELFNEKISSHQTVLIQKGLIGEQNRVNLFLRQNDLLGDADADQPPVSYMDARNL